MVSSRKRALRDTEPLPTPPQPAQEQSPVLRIRNSWQFANLFQWIYLFGRVVKIDESLDIDDLEAECLKPKSTVLLQIGLALLKFVSSHRGLTPDLFDKYARRQYVAKAPDRNPFGTDEAPAKFDDFDALVKIRVLQQLTQWIMLHPERIREKMDEQKPSDQTDWRIEPVGWDSDDRTYYILDDNRLYRLTPAAPAVPAWKPKKNTKKAKAAARAAKRRRISRSTAQDLDDGTDEPASDVEEPPEPEDDGLGGATWECLGVGLNDVRGFLATLRKTRDDNEKILRDAVEDHLLPILEKQEEARQRKALQKEKELLNLEKMAHAKRSSRIANKAEQQKLQEQAREEEEKRLKEAILIKKEVQRRLKAEREHDNRAKSRDERLRERQARRLQHEEELAQLSEDSKTHDGRMSQRQLKAEIEKNRRALQEIDDEEDSWVFDCLCGVYGQVDDGTHSVACERCNVWQHSKCLGISEEEADRDDFHFICKSCRRSQETKPPVVKLKISKAYTSSSTPDSDKTESPTQQPAEQPQGSRLIVQLPGKSFGSTQSEHSTEESDRVQLAPVSKHSAFPSVPVKTDGKAILPSPASPFTNGDGPNPFSSPHPALSPPEQSPNKSRAYSTLLNPLSPIGGTQSSLGTSKLPPQGVFRISPPNKTQPQPKSMPPHADATVPSVAARSDPPLQQPFEAASSHLTIVSPSTVASMSSPTFTKTPAPNVGSHRGVLSTPQLDKVGFSPSAAPASLPPQRNGMSPTKRSPPPPQQLSGSFHSSPGRPILPPVAALSPSPSQQILTPPVKHSDPVRPGSQQSNSFGSDI
ncbi:hypothetical protein F5Y16DRAFT_369343 [Xylariaceae sp. FL0255]|nr:hypothetical protein F5Y16DRAFT_369343 [Xylariaceae sp. FL0255]